jgi:hypothetical protein
MVFLWINWIIKADESVRSKVKKKFMYSKQKIGNEYIQKINVYIHYLSTNFVKNNEYIHYLSTNFEMKMKIKDYSL